MLLPKPVKDLECDDIEEFCRRFNEGIRVEYKSNFDDNVKNKLPRIVSSFANSYGGVLIVGIRAPNGVPQEPFNGIVFEDREPRLTVENLCRANIYPDVLTASALVPSRVSGSFFLVIEVDESSRAPHAIENSTRVYIRTEGGTEFTKLADLALIERLISRRKELYSRWDSFILESQRCVGAVRLQSAGPHLELTIGPRYPSDAIFSREDIFSFLATYRENEQSSFKRCTLLRHPSGAILTSAGASAKYLNVGIFGMLHYVQPLYAAPLEMARLPTTPAERTVSIYPFWWIAEPMQTVLTLASHLFAEAGVHAELRVEAKLQRALEHQFTLGLGRSFVDTRPVSAIADTIPASTYVSSELLHQSIGDITIDVLYQLRWPLGTEKPHSRPQIQQILKRVLRLD